MFRTFIQISNLKFPIGLNIPKSKRNSELAEGQVVLNFDGPKRIDDNGPGTNETIEASIDIQLDFDLALSTTEGLLEILASKRDQLVEKIEWSKTHGIPDSSIVIRRTARLEKLLAIIDSYSETVASV